MNDRRRLDGSQVFNSQKQKKKTGDFLLRSRKTRNKVDCLHANKMDAASIENVGTYVEENKMSNWFLA